MKTLRFLFYAMICAILISSHTSSNDKNAAEFAFYVSPEGSDSQAGTSVRKAFATLEKARDAIRAVKQEGELESPVTVYLRGGTYELTEPFVLSPEDSGTEACPVTYRAYNQEKVIISGGI